MMNYGTGLEWLILTAKPSTGEAAISMITDYNPMLQLMTVSMLLKTTNLRTMTHYDAMLERFMLTGKPSPGEAAISMIQEHHLQLQSIAILHVLLKSTNLKAMTHYPIVMVKLVQILKPSTGDQASSTILEKILKLQLMLVDQRLLKITNLESMIVYGAMLEPLMAQLSTGNQASSMIKESFLELQSVAVDWWSLKIINLKTMKHYGVMLERLMLTGKLSLGEVAISMIQERRLQLQSMTI